MNFIVTRGYYYLYFLEVEQLIYLWYLLQEFITFYLTTIYVALNQ